MRARIVVGAIAAAVGIPLCTAASAQVVDIEWSVSNPLLTPDSPTTTVMMTATWDEDLAVSFAASDFRILGVNTYGGVLTGASDNGVFHLFHNMMESLVETDPPNDNNDLLNGWALCNYAFGGFALSPMQWWFEFTATDFTPRTAVYTSEFDEFLLLEDWWGDVFGAEPSVTPVSFRIAPAPATAGPLVAESLLLGFRKRRQTCLGARACSRLPLA